MANAEGSPPGSQLALTAEQKKTVLAFLDDKERSKLLEDWLAEWGISSFKAKVVVRVLVPALKKFLGGVAERGLDRLHETLRGHFDFYENLSSRISVWLFYKIENKKVPQKVLRPWIENPPGSVSSEEWAQLDLQTRVWFEQLEKLDLIALALEDLKASVSLRIDRPGQLKREPLSHLLRAHNSFIPLFGRDQELAVLHSFADHTDRFRWLVLTGDGGEGKTRLALGFAALQEEHGWTAGFLSAQGLERWVHHDGFPRWSPLTDTLVVADYAASKVENLKPLLERFTVWSMDEAGGIKLRLLLLEREGTKESGWVHDLCSFSEGALRDQIANSLTAVQEMKAPGREDPDKAMVEILRASFEAWATLPGPKPPDFPELTQDDLREIRRSTEGRPLFLQMAALRACAENNPASLARWDRADLLEGAVGRERNYIRRFCNGDSILTFLVERGVALLTFTGPMAKGDPRWLDLLSKDFEACGYPKGQPGEVSGYIARLLGESQANRAVSPLAPDILAEALAVTVLKDRPQIATQAIEGALDCSGKEAWANLLRAITDTYALTGFAPLEHWVEQLITRRTPHELLAVEKLVPTQTLALTRVAVVIGGRLLGALSKRPDSDAERAQILDGLGFRCANLGRGLEAFRATWKAVRLYRRLAAADGEVFEQNLALGLNNLGSRYAFLGRHKRAMKATKEAVEIFERLAANGRGTIESDLAMSLSNLGNRYGALNLKKEALEASEQAVEIYSRLAKGNPETFAPSLAGSLNNLANRYMLLGLCSEALKAIRQSLEIRERLAARDPGSFEPDLARSLSNLCIIFSNCGIHDEEAVAAGKRAVEIYERLARRDPDIFERSLAATLCNLGPVYSAAGHRKEALQVGERAVEIYERLSTEDPDTFEPNLAMGLRNLGIVYMSDPHQREKALAAVQRAVEICRSLAEKDPDAYGPDVAGSLRALGYIYITEAPSQAPPIFKQCIEVLRRLFLKNPRAFAPLMGSLVSEYQQACELAAEEPDAALLGPIIDLLNNLEGA